MDKVIDKVTELSRALLKELDERIAATEKQIAGAQAELHELKAKRAALTGETLPGGISPLGVQVIAANNSLSKLRRVGASKTDILKAERELAEMRTRLAEQKRGGQR